MSTPIVATSAAARKIRSASATQERTERPKPRAVPPPPPEAAARPRHGEAPHPVLLDLLEDVVAALRLVREAGSVEIDFDIRLADLAKAVRDGDPSAQREHVGDVLGSARTIQIMRAGVEEILEEAVRTIESETGRTGTVEARDLEAHRAAFANQAANAARAQRAGRTVPR